jgi:hypothetical protein
VLLATTFTAIGFAFDAGSGNKQLSFVFAACYFIGCVLAVLAARQNAIFTTVIQPPLILFVSVPMSYFLFTGSEGNGIKDLLINCAYPLIERFPLMFFTSAAALLVGMGRWYHGMSMRKSKPSATTDEVAGGGLASALTAKVSALFSRPAAEGDAEELKKAPPRRRRTAEASARKPAKRTAPPRSRHTRPPETEIIAPVADRPRRPRTATGSGREADQPPSEPRRRSRTSTRRSVPPPSERRSAYERPERRHRPEDPREPQSSNGNGTHHPVSNVRYRSERDGQDVPEYRPRRRTHHDRDADSWKYDA